MLALLGLLFGLLGTAAPARAHGVDGPHVELLVIIRDDGVRLAVGPNVAFLAETAGAPEGRVSMWTRADRELLLASARPLLESIATVRIDGIEVTPTVSQFELVDADPDLDLVALYPVFADRAAAAVRCMLEHASATPPETVEVTWHVLAPDLASGELLESGEPPSMVIEAMVIADGVTDIVTVSREEPTIAWDRNTDGSGPSFADVPTPGPGTPATRVPGGFVLAALVLPVGLVLAMVHRTWLRRGLIVAVVVMIVALPSSLFSVPLPWTARAAPMPDEPQARAVFEALHANLYRAFDYTDESQIYDALSRSVGAGELEAMYRRVYTTLLQAENEGRVGRVTGLEPAEFELLAWGTLPAGSLGVSTDARAPQQVPVFTVRHRWRVAGTVYHMGHSHTRVNDHEAEFDVAAMPQGWRIVGQRMLAQERID